MPSSKKTEKNSKKNQVAHFATVFLICLLTIMVGFNFIYDYLYRGKIYPRVLIADLALDGLSSQEALTQLEEKINTLKNSGFTFIVGDKKIIISTDVSSLTDPDLSYELVNFQPKETIEKAFNQGRDGNLIMNYFFKVKSLYSPTIVPLTYQFGAAKFKEILAVNLEPLTSPMADAAIYYVDDNIVIRPEKTGLTFDYQLVLNKVGARLENLNTAPIYLNTRVDQPSVSRQEALKFIPAIKEIVGRADLVLYFNTPDGSQKDKKMTWLLPMTELKKWLAFTKLENGKIMLAMNSASATSFFAPLAQEIDRPVQEARFKIGNDRVTEFQSSRDGHRLDLEKTLEKIRLDFIIEKKAEVGLVVQLIKSQTATGDVNNLGITEIIGVGRSNFAGSPKNRRHNIQTGASALNGLLINPAEEFSLNKALGAIDASTGYLPELVIKGNQTVPEYGGGLCQIGTTMFRTALNAGLPITERKNHSFRVRYYEPAGTDATIYPPHPDLRFVNDTNNYLLLQTKIEGDEAIFELWGTADGRTATTTEIKIFNFISPPPSKTIETEDLKPAEKKCTEHAVTGATTEFTYIVEYPDGHKQENIFKSIYRPWQEVCLVGVKAKAPTTPTTTPLLNQ